MSSRLSSWVFLSLSVVFAPEVLAQECENDDGCPEGLSCVVRGAVTCPPCPEGEACGDCEEETFRTCQFVPEACEVSTGCSNGWECITITSESCDQPACEPGGSEACEDREPTCETQEESWCIPPWALPCEEDADCGGGFTCEPRACGCGGGGSGSSGEGGSSGDPAEEPASEDCECTAEETGACQLIPVPCGSDDECEGGFVCSSLHDGTSSCAIDSEGNEICEESEPPESQCMPPGYDEVMGGGGPARGGGEEATNDLGAPRGGETGASDDDQGAGASTPDESSRTLLSCAQASRSHELALALVGLLGARGGLRRRRS